MEIKLAEALLRRKELQAKVEILKKFKDTQIYYEIRAQRVKVNEGLDDLSANYPKMEAKQVTAEYDLAAKQLRLIDATIQQANWTTVLTINDCVMEDYKAS